MVSQQAVNRIRGHFNEILRVLADIRTVDQEMLDLLRRQPPLGR